tara:strand:- start:684 stop:827 length:144 start_codon:yes stop_codon:yes gene_type:complete
MWINEEKYNRVLKIPKQDVFGSFNPPKYVKTLNAHHERFDVSVSKKP